jgi:hypothetical protein
MRNRRTRWPPDNRTAHDEGMDLGRIIPVATIVGLVANGLTTSEIVAEYPQLTWADVPSAAWSSPGGIRAG